jgi:hypothetical protein
MYVGGLNAKKKDDLAIVAKLIPSLEDSEHNVSFKNFRFYKVIKEKATYGKSIILILCPKRHKDSQNDFDTMNNQKLTHTLEAFILLDYSQFILLGE